MNRKKTKELRQLRQLRDDVDNYIAQENFRRDPEDYLLIRHRYPASGELLREIRSSEGALLFTVNVKSVSSHEMCVLGIPYEHLSGCMYKRSIANDS